MKVALAQINPIVGDIEGNLEKIRAAYREGSEQGAQLVVTPELAMVGYPPRDLLDYDSFVKANIAAFQKLAGEVGETGLLVGFVDRQETAGERKLYNAAGLLRGAKVVSVHHKSLLPTYDVFDEDRYFARAESVALAEFAGERLGVSICEDIWNDPEFWSRKWYAKDPVGEQAAMGSTVLVNLSSSPYFAGKIELRERMLAARVKRHRLPLVYVNQVGGNDELIFDGCSMVFDGSGRLVKLGKAFAEDLLVVDLARTSELESVHVKEDIETLYRALVLGTRDYLHKNGFTDATVGVSGGIDSAVVTCIAVAALGAEHVRVLSMPGPYSSEHSLADAKTLAKALGIRLDVVDINSVYQSYLKTLGPLFEGRKPDVTEENIQARIRGNTLMALSNKTRCMVLTTGNKSELAAGYCTLYGDMAGGLGVISDVPKTQVYELARFINRTKQIIPESTMTKPPSAELRPNQTDQDTLPPYEVLDAILHDHIEEHLSIEELVAKGHERRVVQDVVRKIALSEYKRRQAPPGLKVTNKAFGTGRRMPITQRWI